MTDISNESLPEHLKRGPGRPKGWPKTGGRKKGTVNKVTAQRAAQIAASGLTPLEYMLKILRSKRSNDDDRKWAAERAAPYCHHRLSATELTGKDGGSVSFIFPDMPS